MSLSSFFPINCSRTMVFSFPKKTILFRTFMNTALNTSMEEKSVNSDFYLSILGKPFPVSKNVWSKHLLKKISTEFTGGKIFPQKEKGSVFGYLSDRKNKILFKGITPLEAMKDLQEGLGMIDTSKSLSIAIKVDELSKYVAKYLKSN